MGEDTWNHCAQVNRSGNLSWICVAHRKYRIQEGKTLSYRATKIKLPTFKCIDICSHFDQLVLWTLYICSFSQPMELTDSSDLLCFYFLWITKVHAQVRKSTKLFAWQNHVMFTHYDDKWVCQEKKVAALLTNKSKIKKPQSGKLVNVILHK